MPSGAEITSNALTEGRAGHLLARPRYHFTSAPFRPPEPDIQMGAKAQPRYQHSSLAGDRELQAQDCHLLAAPAEATKESDQPLIIDSIGTAEVTLRG